MKTKQSKVIPAAQAISYVIDKARNSLTWLEELNIEWMATQEKGEDGSTIRVRQGIVADALTIYLAALFDKRPGTHSLVNSYESHAFIEDFKKHPVVTACVMHRHNRAGHQSEKYGFIVPLDTILSSNLRTWLDEAFYAVCTGKFVITVSEPASRTK